MKIKFKKEIFPEKGKKECVRKFLFFPVFASDEENYYIFWLENATITKGYYAHEWRDAKINGFWIDKFLESCNPQDAILWKK